MEIDTLYASIRTADRSDHDAVVGVLVSAFRTDPLAGWLFPEPSERARLQAGFYRSLLDHTDAEAHLAGDGASIWLTLDAGRRPHDDQARPPATGGAPTRLLALGETLATRHPVGEPHRYLAVMGVAETRQSGGIGTALLRHGLDRADHDGVGTYLEAGSPRSRALYLRHGFTDLGTPVRMAEAPPLQPMWRSPGARTATASDQSIHIR